MNLDELRSVQSKERSKDSLQHLRESFYADVGTYIRGLREERERAAERAEDPFDSAEINQLTDEIQTAEEVVEAVYERRVGKVVKRASLAAAGIPADEEGLTSEEQVLFADLVERIESNKTTVLDVLAGDDTDADPGTSAESDPPSEEHRPADEAAAIAGEHGTEEAEETESEPPEPTPPDAATAREPDPSTDAGNADSTAVEPNDVAETGDADTRTPGTPPRTSNGNAVADDDTTPETNPASESDEEAPSGTDTAPTAERDISDDRTTVRITRDVGSIFGVDEREYDLATEDVVALPSENAGPLIERDAAEKLD